MASGLLLGLLVGGPGLFQTYSASARATCTPPTAFVSSALRLVKGYNLGPAGTERKVTFSNGAETRGVGEFGHCASSGDVLSSRFVNGDEIFAGKVAEMAISGPLQAATAPDIMQSMLHFLGSFCASSHALQDLLKDCPSFSSVAPSYSPRFLPSLENKSNKKSKCLALLLCDPPSRPQCCPRDSWVARDIIIPYSLTYASYDRGQGHACSGTPLYSCTAE